MAKALGFHRIKGSVLEKQLTYSSSFHQISYHYYNADPLLPNHTPVVIESRGKRALSSDVGLRLAVTLNDNDIKVWINGSVD